MALLGKHHFMLDCRALWSRLQMIGPLVLILIHSVLVAYAVIIVVFYLFPHDFYFATPLYLITPVLFFVTSYVIPAGNKLLPFKDVYLEALVCRPVASWCITTIIVASAVIWTVAMFGSIHSRYTYMKSLDEALSSIGVDGVALPEPSQLAKAFNALPDRPEVPFILTRASRLLSPDLLTPMFGAYNKAFLDGVDRNAVLKRFGDYEPPHRIAIGNETSNLPRRDPIRFLTAVAFETNNQTEQKWALATLSELRKNDAGARVQVEIWKHNLADYGDLKDPKNQAAMQQSIDALDKLLKPDAALGFSSISFVSDHIFQQGLDYAASEKIELQSYGANAADKCRYSDDIMSNYERILTLRRRLSAADLVWWEPPGKLFLYYIYLYLGHQTINIGLDTIKMIDSCPGLMDRLQRMYDAPAFRSFQNPDTWTSATPLSPTFNGAAGVRQLRDWLKLGW
jgi:hypothetical protein